MKIIDTIGIDFMVKQGFDISEVLYITPDVQEEFEAGHDTRLPRNIQNLFSLSWFDRAVFLDSYKKMLNSYGGRSFYSMRGFGDISILAALETQRMVARGFLFCDPIDVITSDRGLADKIKSEFLQKGDMFSKSLTVHKAENFFGSK
jgi:hypothetical protein